MPRASISPTARAAQSRYAATLADSQGSITSIRWCGMPPRSASDGLAVAMSIPRYNVIESSASTSASSRARQRHADRRLARRPSARSGRSRDERRSRTSVYSHLNRRLMSPNSGSSNTRAGSSRKTLSHAWRDVSVVQGYGARAASRRRSRLLESTANPVLTFRHNRSLDILRRRLKRST